MDHTDRMVGYLAAEESDPRYAKEVVLGEWHFGWARATSRAGRTQSPDHPKVTSSIREHRVVRPEAIVSTSFADLR